MNRYNIFENVLFFGETEIDPVQYLISVNEYCDVVTNEIITEGFKDFVSTIIAKIKEMIERFIEAIKNFFKAVRNKFNKKESNKKPNDKEESNKKPNDKEESNKKPNDNRLMIVKTDTNINNRNNLNFYVKHSYSPKFRSEMLKFISKCNKCIKSYFKNIISKIHPDKLKDIATIDFGIESITHLKEEYDNMNLIAKEKEEIEFKSISEAERDFRNTYNLYSKLEGEITRTSKDCKNYLDTCNAILSKIDETVDCKNIFNQLNMAFNIYKNVTSGGINSFTEYYDWCNKTFGFTI